jgi:hypothetical protein
MKYPITVTVYLDVINEDLVKFGRYAEIRHEPTGTSFGKSELPESITSFFCEGDDLSRKYLEEEFKVTELPGNPKVLVLKKSFGPDGKDPKPGVYCDSVGSFTVDLKWAAWSKYAGYWSDYAPDVYKAIRSLKPEQEVHIKSFPRKECRGLEVVIRHIYPSMWVAQGAVWSCWDETRDLMNSLNLLEVEDNECKQLLKQTDGDYVLASDLAIKAGYNGIMDFDAFNESVPYSSYTWEPGIDVEIDVKANTFSKLMKKIDDCEDKLLKQDHEEWEMFEKMYTNHKD